MKWLFAHAQNAIINECDQQWRYHGCWSRQFNQNQMNQCGHSFNFFNKFSFHGLRIPGRWSCWENMEHEIIAKKAPFLNMLRMIRSFFNEILEVFDQSQNLWQLSNGFEWTWYTVCDRGSPIKANTIFLRFGETFSWIQRIMFWLWKRTTWIVFALNNRNPSSEMKNEIKQVKKNSVLDLDE